MHNYLCVLTCFLFCVAYDAAASDRLPQNLFRDVSTLEVALEGPLSSLVRNRRSEPELPFKLRYQEADGRKADIDILVKPRGNSRLRNCRFPPLRIDFGNTDLSGTVFEGQNKLKLVSHCASMRSNRDYIAREYQIYRAYNLVTDYSFRVRWLAIEYIDTESNGRRITEPGFLIEEDWAAAARLGMEVLETASLEVSELDSGETALMTLFQFMVGNIDWSALKGEPGEICCHNFKVLSHPGQLNTRLLLPYDFDQSGFVAAKYAIHNESLGIKPMDRMYKGYCGMNDQISYAISRLEDAKQNWLGLVDDAPVSKSARKHGIKYIERSFEFIENIEKRERHILARCRE